MEKNKKIWIGAGCSIAILGIAATTGVLIWKNGQMQLLHHSSAA